MLRRLKLIGVFGITSFLLSSCSSSTDRQEFDSNSKPIGNLHGPYRVSKITDGDTIHVIRDGDDIRVRIIGINTPEIHSTVECYGPEATEFAAKELRDTSVYLEYDSSQQVLDKYGRVLAHVWTENKKLFAAEAIKAGFGIEKTYAKQYRYRKEFLANQQFAQDRGLGLWSACN